jgi:aspartate aminotransferase
MKRISDSQFLLSAGDLVNHANCQHLTHLDILVASDEMYEKLIYGLDFVATASISNDMYQRTITINGFSKSVAMTGWRFGYLATPKEELISAMNKLQSQSTSNINSIT